MKTVSVVVGVVFVVALAIAFFGWWAMIAVGITHAAFGWPAATVGFWWEGFGLGAVVILLMSIFGGGNAAKQ